MAERRGLKTSENNTHAHSRQLLNLNNGNRQGLERAFQALIGRSTSPVATAPHSDPRLTEVEKVLRGLGFFLYKEDNGEVYLSHPLATERRVLLQLPASVQPFEAEGWCLNFAARHFPEMEFYLPYISLRAARQKRPGGSRVLTPEPEYDDDGFLAEFPG
ncbi:MAG TPA: hypothetical protein VH186_27560 [Chloroflexia bacterium]|nr:hypothetical protein [Chloroflexia bacterium]